MGINDIEYRKIINILGVHKNFLFSWFMNMNVG